MKRFLALLTVLFALSCTNTPSDPLTSAVGDWIEQNANDPDSWEPISTEVVNTNAEIYGNTYVSIHHTCRINNEYGAKEKVMYYLLQDQSGQIIAGATSAMEAARQVQN